MAVFDRRRSLSLNFHGAQTGASLIEVMIALLLLSLVISALAAGLITFMKVNAMTSQHQQMTHAVGNTAEALKAAPYRMCDSPTGGAATAAQYDQSYGAWAFRWEPLEDMTVRIINVEFWNPTSRDFTSDAGIACHAGDPGAQRLTIEVSWRGEERRGQVVKRLAT